MASRLAETYGEGDRVEISFSHAAGQWQAGVVMGHDPPGMWVQTVDGQLWYVTNARRVRPNPGDERHDG